jgi:hypothetical protein
MIISMTLFSLHDYANIALTLLIVKDKAANHLSIMMTMKYEAASVFFTQSLGHLVVNAKLDRPLDSHAPQTECMYHYDDDAWGEQHEYESEGLWDGQDDDYHEEYDYEAYPTEVYDQYQEYEQEGQNEEDDQNQNDELEEDDPDNDE